MQTGSSLQRTGISSIGHRNPRTRAITGSHSCRRFGIKPCSGAGTAKMNEAVEVLMTPDGLEKSPNRMGPLSRLSSLCGPVLLVSSVLVGCGPNMFLSDRDRDIKDATQALDTARNDSERAKAYSSRG